MGSRRSKYGNKITEFDGNKYHSKKEANRAAELKLLEMGGEITNLKRQAPYNLEINGVKITSYIADFTYTERNGAKVVEDVKGFRTAEYKIKKRLMLAIHGIEIFET